MITQREIAAERMLRREVREMNKEEGEMRRAHSRTERVSGSLKPKHIRQMELFAQYKKLCEELFDGLFQQVKAWQFRLKTEMSQRSGYAGTGDLSTHDLQVWQKNLSNRERLIAAHFKLAEDAMFPVVNPTWVISGRKTTLQDALDRAGNGRKRSAALPEAARAAKGSGVTEWSETDFTTLDSLQFVHELMKLKI